MKHNLTGSSIYVLLYIYLFINIKNMRYYETTTREDWSISDGESKLLGIQVVINIQAESLRTMDPKHNVNY